MFKYKNRTNYRKKYPGISNEIIEILEKIARKMEYQQYDLKVEHYQIDYEKKTVIYHPSREDWTREGESTVLEIPNFADMTMESQDPGLERDRDQWPLFRTKGADYLLSRIDSFLKFCEENNLPKFICLYIHPWEFWPMEKSYNFGEATVIPDSFITENCGEKALHELGELIDGMQARGLEFKTASELTKIFHSGDISK